MKFSIVIPARDEQANLEGGLDAIGIAALPYGGQVEVIVVLNRCTDGTEALALSRGVRVCRDDRPNLSMIRNTGARAATGDILVTIDADSRMAPLALTEIDRALATGRYIGGGVPIRPERLSAGIVATGFLLLAMLPFALSAGMFWCRREDFMALGGFDERLVIAEDVDFACRLKALGKSRRQRFGTLWRAPIVTSCRKFDRFGDWHLVRRPWLLWRGLHRNDRALANRFFYEFEREPGSKAKERQP